jgi:transposase
MKRFVEGTDRRQSTLFPAVLDEYVGEDNPVRAIDVFVDGLDLAKLGFGGVAPLATGRPAYHPASLLKIYIYGYFNAFSRADGLSGSANAMSNWCG